MDDAARLARAAGILEGEGCFRTQTNSYVPSVTCQMTDSDVIQELQDLFGGNVVPYDSPVAHHKPTYIWRVQGRLAMDVMTQVRPHMFSRRSSKIDEVMKTYEDRQEVRSLEREKKDKFLLEISKAYHAGKGSMRDLAKVFGTSRTTVLRATSKYPNPS